MLSWNRIVCFLLSYGTRKWTIDDYPVKIEVQRDSIGLRTEHLVALPYLARIEGWPQMNAAGLDARQARAALGRSLEHARTKGPLPRPGVACSRQVWTIAPSDEIDAYGELPYELSGVLWGSQAALLTDASRVRHGWPSAAPGEIEACVREHYGIDVSDLDDPTLLEVVRRIEASRKSP